VALTAASVAFSIGRQRVQRLLKLVGSSVSAALSSSAPRAVHSVRSPSAGVTNDESDVRLEYTARSASVTTPLGPVEKATPVAFVELGYGSCPTTTNRTWSIGVSSKARNTAASLGQVAAR
jgi:hypothetical protein